MKNDTYILSTAIKRKNGRKIKKGRKGSRTGGRKRMEKECKREIEMEKTE